MSPTPRDVQPHAYKPHPAGEQHGCCWYSPTVVSCNHPRSAPCHLPQPESEHSVREPVTVFACTEDDMSAGGYGPSKRDPTLDRKPTADEAAHLIAAFKAREALKTLGWKDAMYAPVGGDPFLVIEPGSTGVHLAIRDEERRFWIIDGDQWPSTPMLWRPDR